MVESESNREEDLYQGSAASMFFGFLSFLALGYGVLELILFRWSLAVVMFAASTVAAYIAYRLAGGRGNVTLLRARWRNKQRIDVAGEPCGDWQQKVKLMFEALEKDAGGDYSLAIQRLNVKNAPREVQDALAQAQAAPTTHHWRRLRDAMLRNPPTGI